MWMVGRGQALKPDVSVLESLPAIGQTLNLVTDLGILGHLSGVSYQCSLSVPCWWLSRL